MKMKLFLFGFLLVSIRTFAQDTTWVQTLTFDSISTRRATYEFPADLNNKRFEKVLMYYKLKCSPLTPWDQYDCGEWDYLTYARIFDHTGNFDSVRVDGNLLLANFTSPSSISFDLTPFSRTDIYQREEKNRSNSTLTYANINTSNTLNNSPFNVMKNGGKSQFLITANELINAGVLPGNIESIALYVNSFLQNGELKFPTIALKSTSLTELNTFETSNFTTVYNASRWSNGSQNEFQIGMNECLFYQPFLWNGTDNIIVEFTFENNISTFNTILFENETTTVANALRFDNWNGCMQFNGSNKALTELSDFVVGNEMTIAFWAKGTGSNGLNTTILEAYDTLNRRVLNIHFPWSNNSMYFDAGLGTGYDRIDKAMTAGEIDNTWNHWAFVKNATTGEMYIYKNGALWHSGSSKTIPIGYIHRLIIGSSMNFDYSWKGKLDEFQFFNSALSQTTIQEWMNKKLTNSHPNWSNLMVYYDFDNQQFAEDLSDNDYQLMPSSFGMFDFSETPVVGVENPGIRPKIGFGQGTVVGSSTSTFHPYPVLKEPTVIFEQSPVNRHFEIVNARIGQVSGDEISYDQNNQIVTQTPFIGSQTMSNQTITYYQAPFEVIHDVEIGRYITPYGIGFDLGPNGFTYIYDVTDYQQYLKNTVDLEAHNTQELIDLRFAFIEGIPARDVHNRQPIWSDWRSYQYADMDNNTVLSSTNIDLADTSSMFKIKTRFTGHGHNGSVNCCEWDSKDHQISVNGVPRFTWEIWEESACGDNPNTAQGGTWPYAREGWCPGDMVKEYDHELTPYVTPGTSVALDYDIENVPANDQAQGNGNYIVAMDLISYSAPNFTHDAAIVDILNPNNYEYYKKFNPSCSYPRVIIQNTGSANLTQCTIRIYIENDKTIDYSWTGNLGFLQKEIVEIPVEDLTWWQSLNPGQQTFHAEIIGLENGTFTDEYAPNSVKTTRFQAPEIVQGPFFVWFITNNKASENKYTLLKDNGEVIFQRQGMSNSTHYRDTFDLEPGCYSIILEDSDHDGISFWASQQYEGESSGNFMLRRVGGSTIESFPGDFGHFHRFNFSIGLENLSTETIESDFNIQVFPNPSEGVFYVDLGGNFGEKLSYTLTDVTGKIVQEGVFQVSGQTAETSIDLNQQNTGMYFLQIHTISGTFVKELLKK